MFSRNDLSVLAWIIMIVILSIPVVNVLFVIYIFLKRKANKSVKNFFVAYLILYCLAFFGVFNGVFDNIQHIFG